MGQAREIVERWWGLFEADRIDEAVQLGHADVDVVMPGGMRLRGPDELKPVLQEFRDAFPDLRHETLDVVEAGNTIAVELKAVGSHTGLFRTPQGDVPPTGRTVIWEGVDIITLRDGKIATWHTYYDQMAFLAQLGLLPEPAAA